MSPDLYTGTQSSGGGAVAHDWCVEGAWTVRALIARIRFNPAYVVWDPACGMGTIPNVFQAAGFDTIASDLIDRSPSCDHFYGTHDFLAERHPVFDNWPLINIICNPPYSYIEGIAEAFARRALHIAKGHVAMLLPVKRLASRSWYGLFEQYPPSDILIFCDRPSMPPGEKLRVLGRNAFRGGITDYCWVVWDRHRPGAETKTRWIGLRDAAQRRLDHAEDLRRCGLLPPLEEAA